MRRGSGRLRRNDLLRVRLCLRSLWGRRGRGRNPGPQHRADLRHWTTLHLRRLLLDPARTEDPRWDAFIQEGQWFTGYNNTTPTAAALRQNKLIVVGATENTNDVGDDYRYGFLAQFDISEPNEEPSLTGTHRESEPSAILDIALTMGGPRGRSEPKGQDTPSKRDPWAMRYNIIGGFSHDSSWVANLGFSLASGSSISEQHEDMLVSVEILEGANKAYLFAGQTYDEETERRELHRSARPQQRGPGRNQEPRSRDERPPSRSTHERPPDRRRALCRPARGELG